MSNSIDVLAHLFEFLQEKAKRINSGDPLANLDDLAEESKTLELSKTPQLAVEVSAGKWVPRALENLRLLGNLKQRFEPKKDGSPLVGRYRFEVRPRYRPAYNQTPTNGYKEIAKLGGRTEWSSFQIRGWEAVQAALDKKASLVITAPTGTGKTEVFLLPILKAAKEGGLYLLVYPRVALLRDQLSRALKYARLANVVIGIQYGGVGAEDKYTEQNLFIGDIYKDVKCPECDSELQLIPAKSQVRTLRCKRANHEYKITISREGHKSSDLRLLLTTVESLDNLYLRPEMEQVLARLEGIVLDEAHLYDSLYGAHVRQLLDRIKNLTQQKKLARIACSATIANPDSFGNKLLGGNPLVHSYEPSQDGQILSGIECIYILEQHPSQKSPGPLLLQSLMCLGHGILPKGELIVSFSDSLDAVHRYQYQLEDAEEKKRLYAFRSVKAEIMHKSDSCPESEPPQCDIYQDGECWRGLLGGKICTETGLVREEPLKITSYSSKNKDVILREFDTILATSSLEVGVDEESLSSVVQYGSPRNAAALLQRRGRAARSHGKVAYNLLLLGLNPVDSFTFQYRSRVLDGQVEPPLNPNNEVVKRLHQHLEQERNLFRQKRNQYPKNKILAALSYFKDLVDSCQKVQDIMPDDVYNQLIANVGNHQIQLEPTQNWLRRWVSDSLSYYESLLDVNLSLEDESDFPEPQRSKLKEAINNFTGQSISLTDFEYVLRGVLSDLAPLALDNPVIDILIPKLRNLRDKVIQITNAPQIPLEDYERRYMFFLELQEWLQKERNMCYALINPPDDIRRMQRALYFLHMGLEDGACSCKRRPPTLVPLTYFETLSPIRYQRMTIDKSYRIEQEGVTSVEQLFYPYRLQYRYGEGNRAATIALQHDKAWVQKDEKGLPKQITVEAKAKGPSQDGYRLLQSAELRGIYTAEGGQPIVRFCTECGSLNHFKTKICKVCNTPNLQLVRLFPQSLAEALFMPDGVISLGHYFRATSNGGRGLVKVLGSQVEAVRYSSNGTELFPIKNSDFTFEVNYKTPLAYQVAFTHGVGLDLSNIACQLGKSANDIAPSAQALLKRTVMAVAGVHPDLLRTSFDGSSVWVWEAVEGGGGITQLFIDALKKNPKEVYQALVEAAVCPVYLAESAFWENKNPEEWLQGFHLDLPGVQEETKAELSRLNKMKDLKEEIKKTCSENDGCPSCVQEPFARPNSSGPKRSIAEEIVRAFLVECTNEEFNKWMLSDPPLPLLLEKKEGGKFVVFRP